MEIVERVRQALSTANVSTPKGDLSLTISIGVSSENPELGLENLMNEADQALYEAKGSGRNRVCNFIR